jgi:opacity protein-like surface antigen
MSSKREGVKSIGIWLLSALLLVLPVRVAAAQSASAAPPAGVDERGASRQAGAPPAGDWEIAFTPFLWGAGMDGTVTVAGQQADFEASAKQLIESLDFGLMANVEARRNRWVISFDLVYTDLGKEVTLGSAIGAAVPATLDMSMTIVEGDLGYQVHEHVDVLAGVRGVNAPVSMTVPAGLLVDADGGFVDPILGARFRRNLAEKVWVNLRGDVGGFGVGSDFSWFLGAALGYRLTDLISLDFGYRVWGFDYEDDGELKELDMTLAGFAFGATFHF